MLSDNLIMLRNFHGYSQEEVAEKVGVSRQAYGKWEKGTSLPDIEKCMLLAKLYGTSIDSLIKEESFDDRIPMMPAPSGKYIWGTVTMNDRGQIVIPKAARDTFHLKGGDRLIVLGSEGDGIAFVKAEDFEANLREIMTAARKKVD